jgi:hypothetical protein
MCRRCADGDPIDMKRAAPDDWRRIGQERILLGKSFRRATYRPQEPGNDHDHCEFCGDKFMTGPDAPADALGFGYVTEALDQARWVCDTCFHDFRDEFGFTVHPD